MTSSPAAVVAIALLMSACNTNHTASSPSSAKSTQATASSPSSEERTQATSDGAAARAAWLESANRYLNGPALTPQRRHEIIHRLATDRSWYHLPGTVFDGDAKDLLSYFPTIKALTIRLTAKRSFDELVELQIFNQRVQSAIAKAGQEHLTTIPPTDPSHSTVAEGIDRIRLGAAIALCGLLYTLQVASTTARRAALEVLTQPASYAMYSQSQLQLVQATLEERLLPAAAGVLRTSYLAVREVVAGERSQRKPEPGPQVTYEGLGPQSLENATARTIVSKSGHFAVDLPSYALVKQVEGKTPGGKEISQHWIELQSGPLSFSAVCEDGTTEHQFLDQLRSIGSKPVEPDGVNARGHWLHVAKGGNGSFVRVVTLDGRTCMAAVEGPDAQIFTPLAKAFLASLRAGP